MNQKVIGIIAEKLAVDEASVTSDETVTLKSLGGDDLDKVEIIMAFEDEFNIALNDDDEIWEKSVSDINNYVESLISK